ncbi:hypothetical protein CAPTEDRAFT_222495 [Capitella teleta]|uniref:Uncharacterized protein n=1 Tax=Capitella teleta TaxID=283909 RepID=R7T596_CAPTE|nr:hypothetical protein CAPTEDRAFT_222495 [Capitella teleta]|eukprot:ELT88253.1 hypothetical protein CAPTEDRAFT_222495 [Capitella teleta]
MILRLIICLLSSAAWGVCNVNGQLQVKTSLDGSFSINVQNKTWLRSSDTFIRHSHTGFSTINNTLILSGPPYISSGIDNIGNFDSVTFEYNAEGRMFQAGIRSYRSISAVVFSQTFPDQLTNTAVENRNNVLSGFPTFLLGNSDADLGLINYNSAFSGWGSLQLEKWTEKSRLNGGLASGPVLFFDRGDNAVIISPYKNFMASCFCRSNTSVSWGLMGDVDNVPDGFNHETILFYGHQGINKAMRDWGKLMQRVYNKKTVLRDLDPTLKYIGYYTDLGFEGAYYYHLTAPNKTYEETILEIRDYYIQSGIPYKYLQYDDWFYPVTGSGYGATVLWDADPKVFPHGLRNLYNMTQLPVVAHNRYWSVKNVYSKSNGGKFNFIKDGENALPDDQDFLDVQSNMQPVYTDLFLGRKWLMQMGEAAERNGISIQYCLTLPRNLLSTLEIPAVTQSRASGDYQKLSNNYDIGISSLFADSFGIAPFKDNFWTMTEQPGNKYHHTEPRPSLQAAVALLSTGPVGVSDRIGYSNVSLIHSLIMADGRLLKPSQAATYIDANIQERVFRDGAGPQGKIFSTLSQISGFIFGVIMATDMKQNYDLKLSQTGFDRGDPVMVFDSEYSLNVGQPRMLSDQSPLSLTNCSSHGICLHFTSPVFSIKGKQVILLGETSKMLPLSPERISSISSSTDDLQLILRGSPSEVLQITACDADNTAICWRFNCIIADDGHARLSFNSAVCQ